MTDLIPADEIADYKEVYALLPPYVQQAIDRVTADLKYLDEKELKSRIKPNAPVDALRYSFWVEYNRVVDKGGRFLISNVISGICTIEYFSNVVLKEPGFVEWMIRPPISYKKAMEETLQFGLGRLREIMEVPIYKARRGKDGRLLKDSDGYNLMDFDSKAAEAILKAFSMVDQRVKGAVAQKNLNLNADLSGEQMQKMVEHSSMEDIEKALYRLRRREKELDGIEADGVVTETTAVEKTET